MTQQINLYDPALLRRRDWLALGNLALGAAILSLGIVAAGIWPRLAIARLEAQAASLQPQLKGLRDQTAALGQEAMAVKPDARLAQELEQVHAQAAARGEALVLLQKGLGPQAAGFAEYLRGFARQTPAGLWLTGFTVAGDGAGMEIQGATVDPALIPQYIRRLNGEKAFQGRSFAALRLDAPPAPAASAGNAPPPAPPRYHLFALTPAPAAGATPAKAGQ